MGNLVSIQFTYFEDLDSEGNSVNKPYLGYRIFDDYDEDYNNCYDSIKQMKSDGLTPEGVFDFINRRHNSFSLTAMERGVMLNGEYLSPPDETPDALAIIATREANHTERLHLN